MQKLAKRCRNRGSRNHNKESSRVEKKMASRVTTDCSRRSRFEGDLRSVVVGHPDPGDQHVQNGMLLDVIDGLLVGHLCKEKEWSVKKSVGSQVFE